MYYVGVVEVGDVKGEELQNCKQKKVAKVQVSPNRLSGTLVRAETIRPAALVL